MSSPDATQGKNVQQKQEKSKNEWLLQDHSRVVGKPEVMTRFGSPGDYFRLARHPDGIYVDTLTL
jgi:hypothetical protein